MALPTTEVLAKIVNQDGEGLAGAIIEIILDRTEVDGGYVVPERMEYTADENGEAPMSLWSNKRGSTESSYQVRVRHPRTGRLVLDGVAVVPESGPVDLHHISTLPPYPGKPEGAQVVEQAQEWAVAPVDVEVQPGMFSALHSATKAKEHKEAAQALYGDLQAVSDAKDEAEAAALSASGSETAAGTSAAEASGSASAAATSETNAAASESAAATSASGAASSETAASTSASEAASSASAAASSEALAADRAMSAVNSATSAGDSAQEAADSKAKARGWADEDEDVEVAPGQFSAKHGARKAEASASAAAGSESNAASSEAAANSAASSASTSETNAAASEQAAAGSEANAAGSEANAASSEQAAEAARQQIEENTFVYVEDDAESVTMVVGDPMVIDANVIEPYPAVEFEVATS